MFHTLRSIPTSRLPNPPDFIKPNMFNKLSHHIFFGPNRPHFPVPTAPPPPDCFITANATTCGPGHEVNGSGWENGKNGTPGIHPGAFSEVDQIGYVYIMPIICTISIILNSLTVLVFSRSLFRSPIYTYLSALAVADVVTSLFTLPIGVSRCGACDYSLSYSKVFYDIFIFVPVTNASESCSAFLVIALAAERLLTVHRLERTSSASRQKAYTVVGCIVVAAVALNAPYFFVMDIDPLNNAVPTAFGSSQGFVIYSWIRAALVQFAPLLILICLNIILIQSVRKSQMRYRRISVASKASLREKAQIRLSLMMVGTVVLFVLANIPVAFSYSAVFASIFGESSLTTSLYNTWRVVSHLLAMLGYTLDFVIYCAINRHFRSASVDVLSCHRKRRRISDISPTPSTNKEFLTPTKF